MFARPFYSAKTVSNLQNPNASVFIWVDHSPSMEYTDKSTSNGQGALDLIDSIVTKLPRSVKVLDYDYEGESFVEYRAENRLFKSVHGNVQFEKVLNAMKAHKQYSSYPVLLIFSDFQESTTDQLDSLIRKIKLDMDIVFISLKPESPWNYSLQMVSMFGENAIEVTAGASGKNLVKGKVHISVGNVAAAPVPISVNGGRTEKIIAPFSLQENKVCKVVLDESDPLLFDNTLFTCGGQQRNADIIVLGNTEENFVIAAALNALTQKTDVKVQLKNCMEFTTEDIDRSSIVIINHPSVPCPGLEKLLSARNKSTAAFIYCLNEDSLDLVSDYALLKKRFPDFGRLYTTTSSERMYPVLPDVKSGLWHGFPEKKLQNLSVKSYAGVLPGMALCNLSDGGKLFSFATDQTNAKWIFSAIPLGINGYSNIWESAVYVPILDRLLRYLGSGVASDLVARAGYPIKNPLYLRSDRGYIYDSEGKPLVIPDKRDIVFQKPGVYKIVVNDAPAMFMTVVPDSMESQMNFRTPNLGGLLYNNAIVCARGEILSLVKKQSSGIFYYVPWVLIGLLIILEILLWERVQESGYIKKIKE
jgi:hypothetical protein